MLGVRLIVPTMYLVQRMAELHIMDEVFDSGQRISDTRQASYAF